MTMIVDNSVL